MSLKDLSFFIFLLFIFLACKKYEEGPGLSFRSKTKRLANHWKPEKKLVNGDEDLLTDEEQNTVFIFDESGIYIKRIPNGPYYISYEGTWEFKEKKEKLRTYLSYTYFGDPVIEDITWEILRLKEKELWLEYINSNNDKIEYRFVPENK
jgi:hypothetical protein